MTWKRLSILCAVSIFVLYGGLILTLAYYFRGDVFQSSLMAERTWAAIRLSLGAATAATQPASPRAGLPGKREAVWPFLPSPSRTRSNRGGPVAKKSRRSASYSTAAPCGELSQTMG